MMHKVKMTWNKLNKKRAAMVIISVVVLLIIIKAV